MCWFVFAIRETLASECIGCFFGGKEGPRVLKIEAGSLGHGDRMANCSN